MALGVPILKHFRVIFFSTLINVDLAYYEKLMLRFAFSCKSDIKTYYSLS